MFTGPIKLAALAVVVAVAGAAALTPSSGTGRSPIAGLTERLLPHAPVLAKKSDASVTTSATAPATGFGPVRLPADKSGHYFVTAEIEGRSLRMVVDTGASFISLSYRDAAALGIQPAPADFKTKMVTANGEALAFRTKLREIRVGNILVRDADAIVMPREVETISLLGMSFLNKLKSFEVAGGNMVLTP